MYTVYKHENLSNGKSYIGMTSQNPKKRWEYGWGYKFNTQMWNDIRESDWNTDWEHNILGKFEDKQEALNVEEMFIWLFDSTNDGYNISSYGSAHSHTEETKKKISELQTGEKHHFYGKHHSEESKRKISKSKGVYGILQFSKEGELIAEYPSEMEACKYTGCDNSSISKCCRGNRKSAGGFIWKYKKI